MYVDGGGHGMTGRAARAVETRLESALSGHLKRLASGPFACSFAQGVADAQMPKRSEQESDGWRNWNEPRLGSLRLAQPP